jgi:hypothetical protein
MNQYYHTHCNFRKFIPIFQSRVMFSEKRIIPAYFLSCLVDTHETGSSSPEIKEILYCNCKEKRRCSSFPKKYD